jgi:hypothetical protein
MHISIRSTAAAVLLTAAIPAVAQDGTWQQVRNPAPVIGLDGKPHAAACSGYPGTDPGFSFWHKPGRSKNLVVYFEGGGACWDNFSCTFPMAPGVPAGVPQLYMPQVPPGSPASYSGIFDATQAANPVRDWSFVYIPYCTGDVHIGSADRTYSNAGHPVFPLPSQFGIHHGGYDNFMVVLDWMRRHVDKPSQILVAGSSAGGYGASAHAPWVAQAFPKSKLAVLADASQGVLSTAFDTATPGRNSWDPQLAPDVFGSDPNKVPSDALPRIAADALPKARFAQFTTTFDAVQIQFFGVSLFTNPAPLACPSTSLAVNWNSAALRSLDSAAASTRNYRHYVAAGTYHTILRSPQFYTEASAGIPFAQWTAALLRQGDDPADSSAEWLNVACPNCLTPIACP